MNNNSLLILRQDVKILGKSEAVDCSYRISSFFTTPPQVERRLESMPRGEAGFSKLEDNALSPNPVTLLHKTTTQLQEKTQPLLGNPSTDDQSSVSVLYVSSKIHVRQ